MGLFDQFLDVIEWTEFRDNMLFWKWPNDEIKKGSKLIIRPGQNAIFMYNGAVEGVFQQEGRYEVESDIIPLLSTLKGFKFGFNSGLRAEVLFVNMKEITCKWGTKNEIYIPTPSLPGGLPIRAFGTFNCHIDRYDVFVNKIAGIRDSFTVEDVRDRIMSQTDQLLMKWISKEGRDMFNLQANAKEIAGGICGDLDQEMSQIGIRISGFAIASVSYPEEVQAMVNKAASQSMVGDVNKYQQIAMADALASGKGGAAADMAGMSVGMMMGQQMVQNMQGQNQQPSQSQQPQAAAGQNAPKFCPNCGAPAGGGKFCSNCGQQLIK